MKDFATIAAASVFALTAGTLSASADSCSGHSHNDATAAGAVGGGLIGGMASHSVAGGLIGAVAGGFAGNAIARSGDCSHHAVRRQHDSYYIDDNGHRHYYR